MAKSNKKQEALTVTRLINEVLVQQLDIPLKNIVNDTAFSEYTGLKRPDLIISDFPYDGGNEKQYIENIVAYAEIKDNCSVDDKDWKDAIKQGKEKSKKLKIGYFIVSNLKTSRFYNSKNGKEILLNGNSLRDFQTIDILRLIKAKLDKDNGLHKITTNADTISAISEAVFNKKLWELATVYRGIGFKDNTQKIDFTIGMIALEFFEEKERLDGNHDSTKIYWSDCKGQKSEIISANLTQYIIRLEKETTFSTFIELMEAVRISISGRPGKEELISPANLKEIYEIIDSMSPLHGCGFDLFGAVYEMFASNKEKKDFGEYFTRRHYTHIFTKLLLAGEQHFDKDKKFTVLDLACGTGGFLTEAFSVIKSNYTETDTLTKESLKFLSENCFYGVDVREENISRTKINMFLVGDGHTHMVSKNSLTYDFEGSQFDYIVTNPPYGVGNIQAETSAISTVRTEIAFLCKIINLMKVGGKSCVIIPDGVLENPSFSKFRKEILEKCNLDAVLSLPKFAFAPYTKEKTYALFLTKRSNKITKPQKSDVWMYIIDNDGLANSDKRFHTKLRNTDLSWIHDEISGWINKSGEEELGALESRWMKFDDINSGGTSWVDEKGVEKTLVKGGFISVKKIISDKHIKLLPEYYLRPYSPKYVTIKDIDLEYDEILGTLKEFKKSTKKDNTDKLFDTNKTIVLSEILSHVSRNDSLSEEGIYKISQHLDKDKVTVLSGSLDGFYGYAPSTIKIHKLVKKPCIQVVTRGQAGKMRFHKCGNYATNTNSMLLYIKSDAKKILGIKNNKEEEEYLKFLEFILQPKFDEYTSSADLSVLPLTKVLDDIVIPLIVSSENLRKVVERRDRIAMLHKGLSGALSASNTLSDKILAID
ncbi:class I SAM-dependent DNA methyltransferase [Shewanella sp. 10N.286.51.B2]|uniref:HsdM family class I SAM-dependent methyltransferase n=1 Tax=Shewanella sp. 10N.286.51.B2 TaxID=3229707 RepID=UPI00355009F5